MRCEKDTSSIEIMARQASNEKTEPDKPENEEKKGVKNSHT